MVTSAVTGSKFYWLLPEEENTEYQAGNSESDKHINCTAED